MRRIVSIFRKDARHLWPQILVLLALVLLAAFLDPTYTRRRSMPAESLIWAILPLACWNLIIMVIHEERLAGDRQYWLTRPYTWRSLLAAKALFVAVFVNLPVLVTQAGILAAVGISPLDHLPALLWRQVFFSVFLILPAAALAAVTRDQWQVILAVLLILVPPFLLSLVPFIFRAAVPLSNMSWGGHNWLKTMIAATVVAGGAGFILFFQYSRRATLLSRAVLAGTVALVIMSYTLAPRNKEFAVQALLSRQRADYAGIHVSLAPQSGRPFPYLARRRRLSDVRLEIPVRVDGVPPDLEPIGFKTAEATLSTAAGAARQAWKMDAELGELQAGERWLSINVDRSLFDRVKNTPADLYGSIELTLFARTGTLPAPQAHAVTVSGGGVCSNMLDVDRQILIGCYTPFPAVALALEFPGGGRHWIIPQSSVDAPLPVSSGFQPLEKFTSPTSFQSVEELRDLRLVTERPVAHVRQSFYFKGIRLADYSTGNF